MTAGNTTIGTPRGPQTSARYLWRWGLEYFATPREGVSPDTLALAGACLNDCYIKARACALINKIAFWPSLLLSIAAIGWPVIALAIESVAQQSTMAQGVSQSIATAGAGFCLAVYIQYKRRQTAIEAAMRGLLFGKGPLEDRVREAAATISRIDHGFRPSSDQA